MRTRLKTKTKTVWISNRISHWTCIMANRTF